MRLFTAAVLGVILAASIHSALAFSNIWSVDGWDADRLREAGISVRAWKHLLQSEDPPLQWVQVTFDCSRLPEKQEVIMTAWIISDRQSVTALRAERNRQSKDTVTLLFSVQPEYRPQSHLDIFIWVDTADGGKEACGYKLSVKRIIDLAREETATKGIKSDEQ